MSTNQNELQAACSTLRQELKTWEKQFAAANNGRKAGRDDIKAHEDIALKYKEYNRLRDIISGKINPTVSQDSPKRAATDDPCQTPRKRRLVHATTPTRAGNPKNSTTHDLPTPEKELSTPAHIRTFVGPTPQKDGVVLGLFDLLPATTPSRTSRMVLGEIGSNVAQTPSRNAQKYDDDTVDNAIARGTRTPMSSGKRFLLDKFVTPVKRKLGEEDTPSSIRQFATPSFLRRDSQGLNAIAEEDESPKRARIAPWKRPGLGRSLSSMIQGLKKVEEERLDEDLDILRDLETESGGNTQHKRGPPPVAEDSQPDMRLGPDKLIESDEESAGGVGDGLESANRKVWKKKGQKRQTRRVLMRPVQPKPVNTTATNKKATEIPEELSPSDEEHSSDSEYDSDDSTASHTPKARKTQIKESKATASLETKSTGGALKKTARKVSAQAHANFRKLKIKSKNPKGQGRGRFGPVADRDNRTLRQEMPSVIVAIKSPDILAPAQVSRTRAVSPSTYTMAKRALQKDQIVKLIVGAGQASPSPPVGPALGSKGVKSMDFCKEFNARTAHYVPGTPIPARVTVRPDRSFHFELRTPPTATLLLAAAGVKPGKAGKIRGAGNVPGPANNVDGKKGKTSTSSPTAGNASMGTVGQVSLKHVWEIAKIKQSETRLSGLSMEGIVKSIVAQAGSLGVAVVP